MRHVTLIYSYQKNYYRIKKIFNRKSKLFLLIDRVIILVNYARNFRPPNSNLWLYNEVTLNRLQPPKTTESRRKQKKVIIIVVYCAKNLNK